MNVVAIEETLQGNRKYYRIKRPSSLMPIFRLYQSIRS